MTTPVSAALVPTTPVFTNAERLALAGFLAGYSGLTRQAHELDLRQFAGWCQHHHLKLFLARRADIECFARDLEARGRGSHRPRRRNPSHAPQGRRLPGWLDLRHLAAGTILDLRGDPERPGHAGMDRPGREPGHRRAKRERQIALRRGSRSRRHRQ